MSAPKRGGNKRKKAQRRTPTATIQDLPVEILQHIFGLYRDDIFFDLQLSKCDDTTRHKDACYAFERNMGSFALVCRHWASIADALRKTVVVIGSLRDEGQENEAPNFSLGDRKQSSSIADHLKRWRREDNVRLVIVLGLGMHTTNEEFKQILEKCPKIRHILILNPRAIESQYSDSIRPLFTSLTLLKGLTVTGVDITRALTFVSTKMSFLCLSTTRIASSFTSIPLMTLKEAVRRSASFSGLTHLSLVDCSYDNYLRAIIPKLGRHSKLKNLTVRIKHRRVDKEDVEETVVALRTCIVNLEIDYRPRYRDADRSKPLLLNGQSLPQQPERLILWGPILDRCSKFPCLDSLSNLRYISVRNNPATTATHFIDVVRLLPKEFVELEFLSVGRSTTHSAVVVTEALQNRGIYFRCTHRKRYEVPEVYPNQGYDGVPKNGRTDAECWQLLNNSLLIKKARAQS